MFSRHNVSERPGTAWRRRVQAAVVVLVLVPLSACQENSLTTTGAPAMVGPDQSVAEVTRPAPVEATATAPPTAAPVTPTPSKPLAALVNGAPIYLEQYEAELARYEQAQAELGQVLPADYRRIVLDALIERLLIMQAAEAAGIDVSEGMIDAKAEELEAAAGDNGNFMAWREANQWEKEDEFRAALEAEMITAEMRDRVTADVPLTVEQVHARYLQVDDAALAASLLDQVRGGSDFGLLAAQYSLDRVTAQAQGDLGYFARGWLRVPEVEQAAFALAPGEVSDVIAVPGQSGGETYYLVQVIEKDAQRPMTADMRYTLLQQTFETWLQAEWDRAVIERFVETGA